MLLLQVRLKYEKSNLNKRGTHCWRAASTLISLLYDSRQQGSQAEVCVTAEIDTEIDSCEIDDVMSH